MRNEGLSPHGMELFRRLDVVDQLARIECPTLVCVGELDSSVTPRRGIARDCRALRDGPGDSR